MKTMKQLLTLGLITFLITSCNEKESTPTYPPTITSFEVNKTDAYPEESIIVTADATCESNEPLNYSFTSNKGTIKVSDDPKNATLTLPRTDGEVIVTLDVKSSTDSISDIKTVNVIPTRFYDRFINTGQDWLTFNADFTLNDNKLNLKKGSEADYTYGCLAYPFSNPSSYIFKGFKTKLSFEELKEDTNLSLLRINFLQDPNKTTGKQLYTIYIYLKPSAASNEHNWWVRVYIKDYDVEEGQSSITYSDITSDIDKYKNLSVINSGEEFNLELKYNELAELQLLIDEQELLDSKILNNYLISESCTTTNYVDYFYFYVYNSIQMNVDYIYFPK